MGLRAGIRLRFGSHVAGGLISLAALPLLVRHLGAVDFGRYVAILSVLTIAALASDLGVTGLVLREAAVVAGDRRERLLAGLLGVRLSLAALGAVAAIVFVTVAGYGGVLVAATAVATAGLLPQIYTDMAVATLTVDERFGGAALVELARSVAGTVLVLVLVVANAGVGLFLIGWAAAALIGGVVARGVAGAATPLRPARPDPGVRALLRDARAYSLATILHVLYFRAAMVVTSLVGGAVQVGYFAVAFRLSEFFAAGAAQTASSATPTLARAATEYLSRVLYSVLAVAATLGATVGAAVALGAPLIVQVIGGDAFAPAVGVVRLQAIAIGLMFVVFNLGATVFVLREHRRLALLNAAGLSCVVVVALLLVPGHGARGASIASICGEATMLIGYAAVVARRRRGLPNL